MAPTPETKLTAGVMLGPYRVESKLGQGGMGEVWKAHDTRLGRSVAIKVSAAQFSERFNREARAVAALNHPNICTLYDVGPNYLVMELVEGHVPKGPLPLEKALHYARQIADALQAAHEKGIIHRDLKPANLKITPDGTVKVLDFGLAKTIHATSPPTEEDATQTAALTAAGAILGTAPYMSPEQAEGKPSDKRADIWAFGVVFHELLTGQRLFPGQTASETLVAVLTKTPEYDRIPTKVQRLLRSCLEKDPKRRLHDIADAGPLLDDDAPVPVPTGRNRTPWMVAGALAAGMAATLAVAWWAPWRTLPPAPKPVRFQVSLNVGRLNGMANVSPDGLHLAFAAAGGDGVNHIWIRDLDAVEAHELTGADSGQQPTAALIWSPDSRFIAFDSGGKLKKIAIAGGLAQTLCNLPSPVMVGGSWGRDGVITFGNINGYGIMRVSEAGGTASAVTVPDESRGEAYHVEPTFLPDGRHFLYLRTFKGAPEKNAAYVGSLDVQPGQQDSKPLLATTIGPTYVQPEGTGTGQLLFLREGTLMAQPFNAKRLELTGVPEPVAGGVFSFMDKGMFSASPGVLAYRNAIGDSQLTWRDRGGRVAGTVGEAGRLQSLALSPDGRRVAVARANAQTSAKVEIQMLDLTPARATRFTSAAYANLPVWSPDGNRIIFHSQALNGGVEMYQKPATGSSDQARLLPSTGEPASALSWARPTSFSPDGRYLLYESSSPNKQWDLWSVSLDPPSKPVPFLQTGGNDQDGQFSPQGRWVAYTSDESGREEVYLRTFPEAGESIPVSSTGGHSPRWRADGKELFYLAADGKLMSVEITPGRESHPGTPKALFQANAVLPSWSVSADGQRFLFAIPTQQNTQPVFTVVLSWMAALKN